MNICENIECAKAFSPPKRTSRFCSNACKHLGHRSTGMVKSCKRHGCSNEFRLTSSGSRKVYCSTACANKVTKPKTVKLCKGCQRTLLNRRNIFCSNACHNNHKYIVYIQEWLDGKQSGGREDGCTDQVRRWIRELYGLFCWDCGWNKLHPLTGEPPLQIDHIDGDSSNNRPENLRLICGGCHSLTPTYGNFGGRKSSRTYRYDKKKK
jgi:hypothetical protein